MEKELEKLDVSEDMCEFVVRNSSQPQDVMLGAFLFSYTAMAHAAGVGRNKAISFLVEHFDFAWKKCEYVTTLMDTKQ